MTDFLKDTLMTKTLLTVAALLVSVSFASAQDKMACDDATIMKMEEGAKAMTDPAMKESMEMAMKEVEMAKMAMKEGKTDDCMKNLENAMKATEMKK
jgi:predicted outer membrane protein